MPATLKVIPESAAQFDIRIGNVASIGSLPDCTVCLASVPAVSRQHALIRSNNGSDYQIVDLGSLNGTYVNGHRVVLPARLEDGARIRIADNYILFTCNDDSSDEEQRSTLPGSISGLRYVSSFVALMVCDIRGYTAATERLPKGEAAQMLGGWFREAGNLIQHSGGNIDKFLGDAFFAYWTEPGKGPPECEAAYEAGRKLLELAATLAWPDGGGPFEIAVALNCGNVTCPNIGPAGEQDAMILGDAVNTVFRLEPLAKALDQRLIASQEFVSALPSADGFVDLGEHLLKGKRHPVQVFGFRPLPR